jgi:excisionase family DNA binding protein
MQYPTVLYCQSEVKMANELPTDHTDDRLLTPGEVAELFRVEPKTVTRWADAGRIASLRTTGRHRRLWASSVYALVDQVEPVEDQHPDR